MQITGNKMVTNYSMLSNKIKGCLELIATNQLQMTKNVKVQKKIMWFRKELCIM